MLHRYPTYCSRIICTIKYNLVLQRYQIWSLKSLPFSPKSTSTILQVWWLHTLMPHLFPMANQEWQSHIVGLCSLSGDLAKNHQADHLHSPQSKTGLHSCLQWVHVTKGITLGVRETSSRGHLPEEMVECVVLHCHLVESSHWRWMKKDGWLMSCRPLHAVRTSPAVVCPWLAKHLCPCCDWMGHYTLLLFLLQVAKHGSSMQGLEVLRMGNINPSLLCLDLQTWY